MNGEALLDGIAAAPGMLTIRSPGYESVEMKLPEPPAVLHDVALVPVRDTTLDCRVIAVSGDALPGAVVELTPEDPIEVGHVAVADAKGVARFFDLPAVRRRGAPA